MTQMPNPTQEDVEAFCDLCMQAYKCWAIHLNFFHNLVSHLQKLPPDEMEEFNKTPYAICLQHLLDLSHRQFLLEIAKLHDPAIQRNSENLSIQYFEKQESWTIEEKSEFVMIAQDLTTLFEKIKSARDKIIAHNDRSVYAKGKELGGFLEGEDDKYFSSLEKLCAIIWKKWGLGQNSGRKRAFNFTRSGIQGDSLCPANAAREFCGLIVRAISRDCTNTA